MRRRAIGQILLLAAGFLVLVAISAASVMLVNQAREDSGRVVHTVEVENQIRPCCCEIRRAESAARGYLLTSDAAFLTEHEAAVATILPDVDKLAQTCRPTIRFRSNNAKQLRRGDRSRGSPSSPGPSTSSSTTIIAGGVAMLREAGAGDAVRRHPRSRQRDARRGRPAVRAADRDRRPHASSWPRPSPSPAPAW